MKRRWFNSIIGVLIIVLFLAGPVLAENLPVESVISSMTTDGAEPVDYLIDNSTETGWGLRGDANYGWAELTLKESSLIYGIDLVGRLATDTELVIDYKVDDRWVPFLASSLESLPSGGFIDLSYDRVVGDKLRLRLMGSGAGDSIIYDLKVEGKRRDEIFHQIRPEKIIASSDTLPTSPARLLVDGNTYTAWQTSKERGEIEDLKKILEGLETDYTSLQSKGELGNSTGVLFDLGEGYHLTNINLFMAEKASGRIHIAIKTDNSWQQIRSLEMNNLNKGWQRIDLMGRNITTDQIKVTLDSYEQHGGWIGEIQFFGYGNYHGRD